MPDIQCLPISSCQKKYEAPENDYIFTLVCTKLWYYFNQYIYGAISNPAWTKEPNPCYESHYLRLSTYDRVHCLILDCRYGADLLNKR